MSQFLLDTIIKKNEENVKNSNFYDLFNLLLDDTKERYSSYKMTEKLFINELAAFRIYTNIDENCMSILKTVGGFL